MTKTRIRKALYILPFLLCGVGYLLATTTPSEALMKLGGALIGTGLAGVICIVLMQVVPRVYDWYDGLEEG